jgi:hypothetical protein
MQAMLYREEARSEIQGFLTGSSAYWYCANETERSVIFDQQRAGVAQSAEQRFCKPQVGGSIPLASSTSTSAIPTSNPLALLSCPGDK